MTWKSWYDARDWVALENWWPRCEDQKAVAEFRDRLRNDIPKIVRRNGMDAVEEPVSPEMAPEEWKRGAEILELGELDAKVDGGPETASVEWTKTRAIIELEMKKIIQAKTRVEGDPSLSGAAHAKQALDILELFDFEVDRLLPLFDEEEREEFCENACRFMFLGFVSGIRARTALGKEFERDTLRGIKVLQGASSSACQKRDAQERETKAILDKMRSSIEKGHTIKAAAEHAHQAGLGTSLLANERRWRRHRGGRKTD